MSFHLHNSSLLQPAVSFSDDQDRREVLYKHSLHIVIFNLLIEFLMFTYLYAAMKDRHHSSTFMWDWAIHHCAQIWTRRGHIHELRSWKMLQSIWSLSDCAHKAHSRFKIQIQVSQVYYDSNDSNDKMIVAMIIGQLLANCRTMIAIVTALLTSTLTSNYNQMHRSSSISHIKIKCTKI